MDDNKDALQAVPSKPVAKKTDSIGLAAANKWMKTAGFRRLDAIKLRARAKVGTFIEQEGEHHIARSALADTFAQLEEFRETCESKLAKAREEQNEEAEKEWTKMSLIVLEQMNRAAKGLNDTRRRTDPNNTPSAFTVPTMPARTVITNNTQIVVQPSKTE